MVEVGNESGRWISFLDSNRIERLMAQLKKKAWRMRTKLPHRSSLHSNAERRMT